MKRVFWFSLLVAGIAGSAPAQNDLIDAAIRSITQASRLGTLLSVCPSYQGLSPRGGCTQADPAGKGLRCGRTTRAHGGSTETCDRDVFSVIRGLINANTLARLEASSLNSARLYAEIRPIESVSHDHRAAGEIADSCDVEYIARKDFVKYRVAVFNSSKVTLAISTPNWGNYQAEMQRTEGIAVRDEALICGWKEHGEPRRCSPR